MNHRKTRHKRILVTIAVCAAVAGIAGCSCPQKLEAVQEENQMLNDRIAELEYQLAQADTVTSAETMSTPAPAAESVYTVVAGDTLWKIAREQLGKGSRYKEILALNPNIAEHQPLSIGTQLKLPPR